MEILVGSAEPPDQFQEVDVLGTRTYQGCLEGHQLVAQYNPCALPRVRVGC